MVKENVKKAPELPKKLEKEWIAYLIDVNAGAQLMMCSMRFPAQAQKLQMLLIRAVNEFHKTHRDAYLNDPESFVVAVTLVVSEMTKNFMKAQFRHTLMDGMPKKPSIIHPGMMPAKKGGPPRMQ